VFTLANFLEEERKNKSEMGNETSEGLRS